MILLSIACLDILHSCIGLLLRSQSVTNCAEDVFSDLRIRFRRYPQVTTLAENQAFCGFLENILDEQ